MLVQAFGGQIMLATAVFAAACTLALSLRGARLGPLDVGAAVAAVGSGLAIAAVTLTPLTGAVTAGEVQLVPFRTIEIYAHASSRDLLIYAGGNVALFVPLGFFLVLALRRLGTVTAAVLAVALGSAASATVEVLQLQIYTRSTDVDDLILNGLGALVGTVLAVIVVLVRRAADPGHRRPAHGVGSRAS